MKRGSHQIINIEHLDLILFSVLSVMFNFNIATDRKILEVLSDLTTNLSHYETMNIQLDDWCGGWTEALQNK